MRILLLFICFLFMFSFLAFSQPAQIDIPINTVNGQNTKTLHVGLDVSATTGIDVALGESMLPPLPPTGAYDIRLTLEPYGIEYTQTWKDYRNASFPFTGVIEHTMTWQLGTGAAALVLNYELPAGAVMNIKDATGGQTFNSGVLTGIGIYNIPAPSLRKAIITVTYTNITPSVLSIKDKESVPADYKLYQNYPNPFNPSTHVRFSVPDDEYVTIKIYDIIGNEVTTLYSAPARPGTYDLNWNGRNADGEMVSSGTYLYRIIAGEFVQSKKMILLK